MLTLDKIYHAAFSLKNIARKTEVIYANKVAEGKNIYLKTENLQKTGSFKIRGAYYKISQLSDEERGKGIVACSAGNHAQGVALAAKEFGVKAIICMPEGAPISKVEATKALGAEVHLVGETYDDAYNYAITINKELGSTFIHPFDDIDVIAGQGTIGLEILDQLPNVDNVVVPIGGGGLISGVAYAIKQLKPSVKIYGVQASNAASMVDSISKKEKLTIKSVSTFADGIAVKTPGELTYSIVNGYVDELVTVTDDEIATAILTLIEKQKLICEGAGAVSVAAVMFNKIPLDNKNTCCILSGGNIDVNILNKVIYRGLLKTGRTANLTINIIDRPGQLSRVTDIIAEKGGNIIGIFYDQSKEGTDVNSFMLKIKMETRDIDHIEEIVVALNKAGISLME